jgi:hypothetical protein
MGRSAVVSASLLVRWSVQASVVRKATGMPEEVRIMASSVGEKSKLEEALADVNLASARPGSVSDRPRSILMTLRVQWARSREGARCRLRKLRKDNAQTTSELL